jgi:isopenicillin N synthase-like dioxygenase
MEKTHKLSQEILSIFAEALGFPTDHFAKAHQITADDAQTTLRLLHYHDIQGIEFPPQYWRAGAHTDFDCLTMLFQRTGEDGLEVCPGREAHSGFAKGDMWTPVEPITGEIVCNIGDMLMSWSDDRFKSLFHRVRCPKIGENQKERYSIAYGFPLLTLPAYASLVADCVRKIFQPGEQECGGARTTEEVPSIDSA